jgi:hypothetical protein
VALAVFASLLRAVTHNRALAGVTFAMGGFALAVAVAVATRRFVAVIEHAPPKGRALAAMALALSVGASLAWVAIRFASAARRDAASSASAAIVVDCLAFALAAFFAARPSFAGRRSVAIAGTAVALLVAAGGLSALRDPSVRAAIEEKAPAFAPLADLVPST